MSKLPLALGISCLAALGMAPPGATPDDGGQTKLSHKAHKQWDFILPAEHWHKVGDELTLAGVAFATETQGPQKLRIDTNADGHFDNDVKGQGGFVTLRGKTDAGVKVRYSVRFRNVAAGKWEWATGSSMSGKVAGTVVHIFDQDGNGRYDDYGVDAIAIGTSKYACLLSKVVAVDGDLHEFGVSADGAKATFSAYEGATGLLDLSSEYDARGKLTAAVIRSGDLSFQVAGNKKGLKVPVGRYELVSGRVERGSASASIRKGRMKPIEVREGTPTRIDWGQNVTGEFDFTQTDKQVKVQSNFAFYGAAGEEYYDFVPRGKGPKILIKDQKRGKSLKEGRFPES